jgi:hypothetical protein
VALLLPNSAVGGRRLRSDPPRILLVAGVPPGSGNAGETALRALLAGYPPGLVSCLGVVEGDHVATEIPNELTKRQLRRRPREYSYRPLPGRWGSVPAHIGFRWRFRPAVKRLIGEAIALGRAQSAEKVWMVLDCVTTLTMGATIAQRLRLPLVSLIWDDPEYLLKQSRIDRLSRWDIGRRFAATLRISERVGVVSDAMATDYARRYGARTILIRHPVPSGGTVGPESTRAAGGDVVITLAGSLYAESAWRSLLAALARLHWNISGHQIRLRVLGRAMNVRNSGPARIEYLGFVADSERDWLIAGSDVLYLPMPFESALAPLSRYSFPAKLSTYIAARRPVFAHAPKDSALARFCVEHRIGVQCNSLDPADVAASLVSVVEDTARQAVAIAEMQSLASGEFSAQECSRRFSELVGVSIPDSSLAPPPGLRRDGAVGPE